MWRETRGESDSGSRSGFGIRYFSGCRFLREHAFVADALSDTRSIEILEKGNNHATRSLDFLPKLARRGRAAFRKQFDYEISHLRGRVASEHNIAVQLDDFLLLDQKPQRLLKILILRKSCAARRIERFFRQD